MKEPSPSIIKKFVRARRYQYWAAAGAFMYMLTCFVGWPLGYFWPSVLALPLFLIPTWLFCLKCYDCGHLAFLSHQSSIEIKEKIKAARWFSGYETGSIKLPLPMNCNKCGVPFAQFGTLPEIEA